ncbi:hypothetical protein MN116_005597 [Schistosoma mekongi]|uniref:Uncharacterized protein n=1 Tax=Schistosoma mekongi TaxID=38744 RepID=A0AAE1Z9Y3_SCHME|nr:hypothetical protein MN116_005597 [Schistosoma mekongi]
MGIISMKKQYFHMIYENVKQLFRFQIVSSSTTTTTSLIPPHIPVMKSEIIEYTQPKSGQVYLDMTFGTGGHANEILKHASDNLICYFLDRDPTSLHYMKSLQAQYSSLKKDTPTAAHVVNTLTIDELSNIFSIYGEERYSKRIANAIVDYRNDNGPIQSTKQLADLIRHIVPMSREDNSLIDPATRVFQALRIFVNDELNELCIGLELAEFLLKPGGHLAVLSFHSLEDRLVKWLVNHDCKHLTLSKYLSQRSRNFLRTTANERQEYSDDFNSEHNESTKMFRTKWSHIIGPLTPSNSEVVSNPRCRSAKLRILKKA